MRETDGGNYFAEYAENNFTHLREVPHVEICNGHDECAEIEPMSDTASAIIKCAVIAVCIACAAAAIWHGVIQ